MRDEYTYEDFDQTFLSVINCAVAEGVIQGEEVFIFGANCATSDNWEDVEWIVDVIDAYLVSDYQIALGKTDYNPITRQAIKQWRTERHEAKVESACGVIEP